MNEIPSVGTIVRITDTQEDREKNLLAAVLGSLDEDMQWEGVTNIFIFKTGRKVAYHCTRYKLSNAIKMIVI